MIVIHSSRKHASKDTKLLIKPNYITQLPQDNCLRYKRITQWEVFTITGQFKFPGEKVLLKTLRMSMWIYL